MQATWINLSTLTIRQKLLGGFAIVLSILALVVLSTLSSLSDTQNKVDNMTREVQPTLIASMNLMNTLQETSKALGFFLLTKEEHREKDYIDHLTKLDGALAELKATPVAQKNTTTMDVINEIEADINEFKAYKNQMVGLTKSINDNFPAVKHAADTLNPINSQFFQTISNMLLSEDEEEVNNDRKQLLKAITNLRYAWSNMTNNARIFLSFGSQDILENINLFVESAGTLIKEIKTHADILTFEQEEGLAKLEPMRQEWVGHLKKLVEIHRGAKARTDAYLLKTNIGPLLNKIDTNLKALLKQQQNSIEQTGDELISQAKSTHQLLLSLLFIGLIVGIGVSLWITSKITRPLKAAALAMNDIAEGDGDLTQRLAVNGHDEIAQLAAGFNTFILKIHNLVQQVTESTAQIAKVTVELTKATHSTSETTEKQKSETEQAATAITEMSATANEVAQNAEMASEAANSAYGQTTAGRQIVNRALAGINGMGETIEENAGIVEQLGKDITDITSIIDVIQGIAEQTNLLALNAAIEAARAGEQGRGFAVVADEVRTLATRTKQSTQDIQDKVEKLQTLANTVVDSIMLNKEKARDTIEQATEAGVSLDAITDAVANITDMVTQIASAAEEQSIVADDANRGIVIISELAEFTDHEAQQLSLSSTDLNQVTGTLQALVNQFKIEKVG